MQVDAKKKKNEERMVVIGKHRVYIFKVAKDIKVQMKIVNLSSFWPAQLVEDFHLAELTEIVSTAPTSVQNEPNSLSYK